MSRRDKKPLAKGSRRSGDRPRGARPYAETARGERAKGKPAFGKQPGSKPFVRLGAAASPSLRRADVAEAPRKVAESAPLPTKVQTVTVTADEANMRVDRFLEARFPGLSYSHIQRIVRKGQLRVNGKRVEPKDRLEEGQAVRIPPLRLDPEKPRAEGGSAKDAETRAFLKSITLYEDDDVMVLNKPMGLAVQGGSGTTRHIDGMLGVIQTKD